jgi:hypothetical protein
MKFEEALPLLREGKTARCTWWAAGSYIYIRNNEFVFAAYDGTEGYTNLCNLDIIDSNWEVFE